MGQKTLDYLDNLNDKLRNLNMSVTTTVKVDEDRIADKVEQRMKRGLSGRTTESIGI